MGKEIIKTKAVGGNKGIRGTDGNTFSSTNQPKRYRGPSILTEVKNMLKPESQGGAGLKKTMKIQGAFVMERNDAGKMKRTGEKVTVEIELPTVKAAALRYIEFMFTHPDMMKDYMDRYGGKAISKDKIPDPEDDNPQGFKIILK